MPLSDIVNVQITQEVLPVSQASFGTILIVGPNCNLDSRVEFFSDAASALKKIVGANTLEAALINGAFAQNPAPAEIALGAVESTKSALFTGTLTVGSVTAQVNGMAYTQAFATDMDTTLTDLAAAIATDTVNVLSAVYTTLSKTLVVTPKTGKTVSLSFDFSLATGSIAATVTSAILGETFADALTACKNADPDWYAICAATRDIPTQELVADWVETNQRVCILGSADANIVNHTAASDTTSIAHYLVSKAYARTMAIYTSNAGVEGVESAWFQKFLYMNAGTYDTMFKTLAGITVDTLNPTQAKNVLDKFANTYESMGGSSITRKGTTGAGEYFDIVVFVDWLTSTMTTSVFQALKSQPKVPYTPAGMLIVQNAITSPLKTGQERDAISPNAYDPSDNHQIGGFVVSMPAFASIPQNDKASRLLQDVAFTAWLSGAIQAVKINGVVTI